ncbi:hypothetical protein SALBM311S_12563 [Streptomyces alboniger]
MTGVWEGRAPELDQCRWPECSFSARGPAVARGHLGYRTGGSVGAMLRVFVEVDRTTMGPERLAAKITAYARLHAYIPLPCIE